MGEKPAVDIVTRLLALSVAAEVAIAALDRKITAEIARQAADEIMRLRSLLNAG